MACSHLLDQHLSTICFLPRPHNSGTRIRTQQNTQLSPPRPTATLRSRPNGPKHPHTPAKPPTYGATGVKSIQMKHHYLWCKGPTQHMHCVHLHQSHLICHIYSSIILCILLVPLHAFRNTCQKSITCKSNTTFSVAKDPGNTLNTKCK